MKSIKIFRFPKAQSFSNNQKLSAKKKTEMDDLEKTIVQAVWHGKGLGVHGILISNLRHIQALKQCAGCLSQAVTQLRDELSPEFVSEEIKLAVNYLDNITGRNIDLDLLDNIFSQFCIGK